MLNHPTYERLTQWRLTGMARALAEQAQHPDIQALTFEERLGLLVEREADERHNRQTSSRLRRARLKQTAVAEDIDYRHPRGLDRALFRRLLAGDWVRGHQNILITGPTGVGKTYLACALANAACRQGYTALYQRLPRLLEELAIAHADGRFLKLMAALARVDVLILDDWGLAILDGERRRDLLELLDERYQTRSTLVTSPLPVAHWHDALGDPTLADAILDRLVHHAHPLQPRRGIPAKTPTQIDGGTHPSVNSIHPARRFAPTVQVGVERVSSWRWNGQVFSWI
jgi:DNA replication protein DnaC